LNVPALPNVQVALCPAWSTSGSARVQVMPLVELKRTVWAIVSLFL
jgi:hypothetical protein